MITAHSYEYSGASYSQTNPFLDPKYAPTEEEPLGIPFPGITSTEGPANWVGVLLQHF
jgi:hypothetical protein